MCIFNYTKMLCPCSQGLDCSTIKRRGLRYVVRMKSGKDAHFHTFTFGPTTTFACKEHKRTHGKGAVGSRMCRNFLENVDHQTSEWADYMCELCQRDCPVPEGEHVKPYDERWHVVWDNGWVDAAPRRKADVFKKREDGEARSKRKDRGHGDHTGDRKRSPKT